MAVGQRMAVARFDDADGVLADRDELLQRDNVLPRPETEMQARREGVGLQARFAVERDDRARRQRPVLTDQRVFLVDDAR